LPNSGSYFFFTWQLQRLHVPIVSGFCDFGNVKVQQTSMSEQLLED